MRRLQDRVASAAEFEGVPSAETIAGVDQAFPNAEAIVSAAIVLRNGSAVDEAVVHETPPIGYVPGLLAFREGPAAIAAVDALTVEPTVVLVDGNGRIHPRQAGLATHLGVVLGRPTVGVAKSLLCGEPSEPLEGLAAGDRVSITAGDDIDAPPGTVVGHAVQTRQFAGSDRHVNPVIVSPGHGIDSEAAAELVLDCCDGYKLPTVLRLADRRAGEGADPKDNDDTA